MNKCSPGFTLLELLVNLVITGIVMTAMAAAFMTQSRVYNDQDRRVAVEEDLRAAMGIVTDTLRRANYGVPTTNLSLWVNWVASFNNNPRVSDTNPDALAVASCSAQPIATLAADTADPTATGVTVTTLTLDSVDLVSNGSLLRLGDASEYVTVTAVSGTTITIDTDPVTSGNQEITRRYFTGTSLCRVEVLSLSTDDDKTLWLNENNGNTAEPVAEGISDFQITTVTTGKRYQVTLTAEATLRDGSLYQRSLTSDITLPNS